MDVFRLITALLLLLGMALPAAAEPTILSVHTPDGAEVEFDLEALEALEPATVVTHTKWTDGPQHFIGVRLSTLLAAAGVTSGGSVQAEALNQYRVELPWADLQDYPVIIAYRHGGEYMRVRHKGPLWIIYPQDDHRALRGFETETKMIWQLRRLKVEN